MLGGGRRSSGGSHHQSLVEAMQEDTPGNAPPVDPTTPGMAELIRSEVARQLREIGVQPLDGGHHATPASVIGPDGSTQATPVVQGNVEGVEKAASNLLVGMQGGVKTELAGAAVPDNYNPNKPKEDDGFVPMYKRLGLPEFLFALDTPPEQLRKLVFDAIGANEESLEDPKEVKEFAKVWLRHHKMYHDDIKFSLDLDVYFALAAHNYHQKEVQDDREEDDGEREAGHHEAVKGLIDDKLKSAGKVVFVACTQIMIPALITFDILGSSQGETIKCYDSNDNKVCEIEYDDRSFCALKNWTSEYSGHTMLLKCVVFIFVGYVTVYGYYMWRAFQNSLYFRQGEFAYFQTVKQFWLQLGLIVNALTHLSVVALTVLILLYTDTILDMILNALALVFITELDNEIVSSEEEEQYVLRLERWLNLTWINWTTEVKKWRKTRKHIRKGFRRVHSTYADRLSDFFHSTGFQLFVTSILVINCFFPFYLFVCY